MCRKQYACVLCSSKEIYLTYIIIELLLCCATLRKFPSLFYINLFKLILVISPLQDGFTQTVTNLSVFTQDVSEVMKNRHQVDTVNMDVSKAFDWNDYHILLHKVYNYIEYSESLLFLEILTY